MGHHEHHDHSHIHSTGGSEDRNLILLRYMYDHNDHHADELEELIQALRAAGKNGTADLVADALDLYRKGNDLLHEAIHHYTEE